MSKTTFSTVFLALVCTWASSCQLRPDQSGISSHQFQDVVVPADFRLDDRNRASYSSEEAQWRHGRFVYLSGSQVEPAAAYVAGRMPHHGWRLADRQAGVGAAEAADGGADGGAAVAADPQDQVRLVFERGIYTAVYEFTRRDGTTRMVVDYATDYSKR